MKTRFSSLLLVCTLLISVVACSVLKSNDTEKKIKKFLVEFSTDIQRSDSIAARHFKMDQPTWLIQMALKIYQKDYSTVASIHANFDQASIDINESIWAHIPVVMRADSIGSSIERKFQLDIQLVPSDTTYFITNWNGKLMYEKFRAFSLSIEEGNNLQKIKLSRGDYYNQAAAIQQKYDSVVWFYAHNTNPYYYVINGTWQNDYDRKPDTSKYQMGLVDQTGNEIVPVTFDMLGMPNGLGLNLIEIKKDSLYGCYDLQKQKILIPAEYSYIIPYLDSATSPVKFLVKKDSIDGWFDRQYQFHVGYPDHTVGTYMKYFKFLPKQLNIRQQTTAFLEVPREQYAYAGYLIPNSYLTYFGILQSIEGPFTGEVFTEYAEVTYSESSFSFVDKITSKLSALITKARDSYVFGREEFYEHQSITFIDTTHNVLLKEKIHYAGDLSFKLIDSTLLEIKIQTSPADLAPFEIFESEYSIANLPTFIYCSIGPTGGPKRLESIRRFTCTEFIKLDDTYITGDFVGYDLTQEKHQTFTTLDREILSAMRDEILAVYGYIFNDPETAKYFSYRKWYNPRYSHVVEFETDLTDTDRHNLLFFKKLLGPIDGEVTEL